MCARLRLGRPTGGLLRATLGALALTLAPRASAAANDCAAELARCRTLEAEARAEPTRDAALAALRSIRSRLSDEPGAACREALARCAIALGRYDGALGSDERVELLLEGAGRAEALGAGELMAQAVTAAFDPLKLAGKSDLAVAWIERALALCEDPRKSRPYLLLRLAEGRRLSLAFRDAERALDEFDATVARTDAAAALSAQGNAVRLALWLELGLIDRAAPLLVRAEATEPAAAPSARRRSWQATVHLALTQDATERAAREAERALNETALYPPRSPERAEMLRLYGAAAVQLAREGKRTSRSAAEALEEALASEQLGPVTRADVLLELAEAELESAPAAAVGARLDEAARLLAATASGARPQWRRGAFFLPVLRARLALREGAEPDHLRERELELSAAWREFLALWDALELRSAGLGLLQAAWRRALPSELIRLRSTLQTDADGARAALAVVLEAHARHGLVRSGGGAAPDGRECVADVVTSDRGLLIYLFGPHQGHVFAVDPKGVLVHTLGGYDLLQSQREAFLLDPGDRRLGASLLPPTVAERVRSWRALVVVGSEALGDLAFETLELTPQAPLGLSHAINYAPAACVAGALAGRRFEAGKVDAAVLACPELSADVRSRFNDLAELTWSAPTERAIEKSWGRERVVVRHGADAHRSALAEALGRRPALLQFLGHGVHLAGVERPASLALAPDAAGDGGLLTCDDVELLRAPELVVLTSCRSGQGPSRRGDDGLEHLGGAWLRAGARTVILANSDVSLTPILRATELLHARLSAGDAPDQALLRVRQELHAAGVTAREWSALRVMGAGWVPLTRSPR